MLYVGLDISLTSTGLVVLNEKAECLVELTIKSKPHPDRYARIEAIMEAVKRNVFTAALANKDDPLLFMVEGFAFSANGKVFDIAELSGVLKYHINKVWFDNPIFYQVPPSTLKQFVTGKGNAGKDLMLKEVYKVYGKDYTDNNIADAYGLARMGKEMTNMDGLPAAQKKAITAVFACNGGTPDGHKQLLQKAQRPTTV